MSSLYVFLLYHPPHLKMSKKRWVFVLNFAPKTQSQHLNITCFCLRCYTEWGSFIDGTVRVIDRHLCVIDRHLWCINKGKVQAYLLCACTFSLLIYKDGGRGRVLQSIYSIEKHKTAGLLQTWLYRSDAKNLLPQACGPVWNWSPCCFYDCRILQIRNKVTLCLMLIWQCVFVFSLWH